MIKLKYNAPLMVVSKFILSDILVTSVVDDTGVWLDEWNKLIK